MFVAALGNAQPAGLDYVLHNNSAILDEQLLRIEAPGVPVRHFQAHGLAQQGLAGAQALRCAQAATGVGVVQLHLCQAVAVGEGVHPGIGGLDQHRVARALGAEIQRIAAAGVIHVDMPAIEEQRLAFLGVAQRGVAAFLVEVVGLGLDDPRR